MKEAVSSNGTNARRNLTPYSDVWLEERVKIGGKNLQTQVLPGVPGD